MAVGALKRLTGVVLAMAMVAPAVAAAASMPSDRLAQFAAYRASHPNPDAVIRQIKAKTAERIRLATAGAAGRAQPPSSSPDASLNAAPIIWSVAPERVELWDGPDYPQMVVVPAGEFTMGSAPPEAGRQANEGPRRRVRIGYSFAVSKYPVTVDEFAKFVADTHYDAGNQCYALRDGKWDKYVDLNWRQPGYEQTGQYPAGCTNFSDAQAYVAWLSQKTGHTYRLLSEAEYEYVDRAGTATAYWWGDDPAAACAFANGFDQDAVRLTASVPANSCHDGYVYASPVGSFKPNGFGLYDTAGNVWSWLADCGSTDLSATPSDGSANTAGDCSQRMLRGGAWYDSPSLLRPAQRLKGSADDRGSRRGIRVARVF